MFVFIPNDIIDIDQAIKMNQNVVTRSIMTDTKQSKAQIIGFHFS